MERYAELLQCEIKGALVQTGIANHLTAHAGAEKNLEHILLKSANDRVLLEQIHDRRVTFENLGASPFAGGELGHVALAVAHSGKPFGAFGDCFSFYLCLEGGSLFFENVIKEFFRHIWPINFLSRF